MDELYTKLEAFIAAFNESQALINSILEKQNAAAAALTEMVAAVEAMDTDADDDLGGGEEIEDPDEAPAVYVAEPSEAPPVSCFTCYAFDDGATPACRHWQQTPPAEVQAVGCHAWVLAPLLAVAEPEPAPEPAPETAPVKRGRGRKAAAASEPAPKPKAPRGKKGPNGLAAVPF